MERSLFENAFIFGLNVAGWLWGVLTFLPWYYLSGRKAMSGKTKWQAKPTSGPGSPYRCIEHFDSLMTSMHDGVTTMDQLFSRSVKIYKHRKCLGTREILKEEDEIQPNGRVFKKLICGNYHWLTYAEVHIRSKNLGSGLAALGQQVKENIVLFADTKAEWIIAAQACFYYNYPVTTVYSTLGEEALAYGIDESEAEFIVTDSHLLPKLSSVARKLTKLRHVVYIGKAKKSQLLEFPETVKVHSMNDVEELGSKSENLSQGRVAPKPLDTAVIMYTSGSTGLPKGVVISHGNLLAAMTGVTARVHPKISENDVYVGYLPLAHVLELVAEHCILAFGASIGYSTPLTLFDQASKIKKGTKGDVSVLRPTVMAAVPVIMDRIRVNVMDKVKEGPKLLQMIFQFAYNYKLQQIKRGYDSPLLNKFIFAKIRNLLGGRVRQMLSGGAPLSEDTQYFMNVCFCCPVVQGYGLTETCGGGTIHQSWDRTTGRVGPPIGSCEIKLVSWEEGGYTIRDKPYPRGEVVIGGAHVSQGYYKNPDKTAECFEVDKNGQRWFHTGDIGEFHNDGCLKIIDRKKDLVKLQAGEYVSLGKVEAAMSQSPYVESICVYAESSQTYATCLVVPRAKQLKSLAASLKIETKEWEELCQKPQLKAEVLKNLQAVGKAAKLEKFEIPQKVTLVKETWTPETELVTAALKLKRKNIACFYQNELQAMYSS